MPHQNCVRNQRKQEEEIKVNKQSKILETKPNMHATKDLYGYELTATQISQMTKDYDV